MISWDACPRVKDINGWTGNGTHADLDLHLIDPNGNRVSNGASYDQSYEIVEVVANISGLYTLEIQKFGWDRCDVLYDGTKDYTYLGLAYDIR